MKRVFYLMILCLAISSCHVDDGVDSGNTTDDWNWDGVELVEIEDVEVVPVAKWTILNSRTENHIKVLDFDKAYLFNSLKEYRLALLDNYGFHDSLVINRFEFDKYSLVVVSGIASGPVDKIDYKLAKATSSNRYRLDVKLNINDSLRYLTDWELQLKVPKMDGEVEAFVSTTRPITNQLPSHLQLTTHRLKPYPFDEYYAESGKNMRNIMYKESSGDRIFDLINMDDSCKVLFFEMYYKEDVGNGCMYWRDGFGVDEFGGEYGEQLYMSLLVQCSDELIQKMKNEGLILYDDKVYVKGIKDPIVSGFDSYYTSLKYITCSFSSTGIDINGDFCEYYCPISLNQLERTLKYFSDRDYLYANIPADEDKPFSYVFSVDCDRFNPYDVTYYLESTLLGNGIMSFSPGYWGYSMQETYFEFITQGEAEIYRKNN